MLAGNENKKHPVVAVQRNHHVGGSELTFEPLDTEMTFTKMFSQKGRRELSLVVENPTTTRTCVSLTKSSDIVVEKKTQQLTVTKVGCDTTCSQ